MIVALIISVLAWRLHHLEKIYCTTNNILIPHLRYHTRSAAMKLSLDSSSAKTIGAGAFRRSTSSTSASPSKLAILAATMFFSQNCIVSASQSTSNLAEAVQKSSELSVRKTPSFLSASRDLLQTGKQRYARKWSNMISSLICRFLTATYFHISFIELSVPTLLHHQTFLDLVDALLYYPSF